MNAQVLPLPSSLLGGKYALLRELGSGSAACVYEAENVLVGKRVAIKLLDEKLARNITVRARFLAEARAAAQLNHPNVVDIHDVGDERGGLYIVMELLCGETLAQVLASRGALPVPYACELVLQVLTALDAAHQHGIVHRDLKPENVLVTHPRPGQPLVKVLDFGIAQGIAGASAEPEGTLMGTPAYMAPEQAMGRKVDHRADLYSCGAVLYELLSGEPPFKGRTPMCVFGAVLQNDYRPLSSCAPHVPEALGQLVDQLLQPSAHARPESAGVAAALLAAHAGIQWLPVAAPIPLIHSVRSGLHFPSKLSLSAPRVHHDWNLDQLSDPEIPRAPVLKLNPESWGLPPGTALPLDSEIRARHAPTHVPESKRNGCIQASDRAVTTGTHAEEEPIEIPSRSPTSRAAIFLAVASGFTVGLLGMWAGGLI